MRKTSTLVCTFVFAITLAPWGLLDYCPKHAQSHPHHGTCGEGMMGHSYGFDKSEPKRNTAPCTSLVIATDDYTAKITNKKFTLTEIAILSILYELYDWELPQIETLIVSEPDSTSDPPLGDNALRGPPLT